MKSDIVVVGASAGGVDALKVLVSGFPPDLNASVFVVLHIGSGIDGHSHLPKILSDVGPLPAVAARHGQQIEKGVIYVAPPDFHLIVRESFMELSHGPKENRTRPAINPLFRSASSAYPSQVAGVVLTGALDDGAAGLAEAKRRGGVAIVQDPTTAAFPYMPLNAIRKGEPDYVLPLPQIATIITELAGTERPAAMEREEPMKRALSGLTCPECRGPIWEERQGNILEYRCRVGHVYSPLALENDHHGTVERTLWSAIVALEEAAEILKALPPDALGDIQERAQKKRSQAAVLRAMLDGRQ